MASTDSTGNGATKGNGSVDQSQDPSSPYYLHPRGNPGMVLVTPQLNDFNYHTWSRAMRRALLSKNKLKFINGGIPIPDETDPIYDAWERCNVMVISWITRTLTPQIAQSTIYIDNAKELWDDLKERFSKGDHFRISDLLQEIHLIKQGERSVSEFYTDLKLAWDELEVLRSIPDCSCPTKCNCSLIKIVKKQREIEYVICFLKGLGEIYGTIKTQVLLVEPIPSINKVFSLVLQQERQLTGVNVGESKAMVNSSDNQNNWRGQGRGNGRERGRSTQGRGSNSGKQCTYCSKLGHTVDQCYYKHRFPPGFFNKPNNNPVVHNIVSEKGIDSHSSEKPLSQASQEATSSQFSTEQVQQLLQMSYSKSSQYFICW